MLKKSGFNSIKYDICGGSACENDDYIDELEEKLKYAIDIFEQMDLYALTSKDYSEYITGFLTKIKSDT